MPFQILQERLVLGYLEFFLKKQNETDPETIRKTAQKTLKIVGRTTVLLPILAFPELSRHAIPEGIKGLTAHGSQSEGHTDGKGNGTRSGKCLGLLRDREHVKAKGSQQEGHTDGKGNYTRPGECLGPL